MLPATEVTIQGRPVRVIGELDDRGRVALENLLSEGDELDRRCRAAILHDASTGTEGPARLYVTHHLAELDGLAARLGIDAPESPGPEAVETFLRAMALHSIWATPDSDGSFLHVDYTIGHELTQYVLCVTLDRSGQLATVDMES